MSECTFSPEIRHFNSASSPFMLKHALELARNGSTLIPLHHITSEGKCSCNKACSSAGKHPRTAKGVKDASSDLKQITEWWTKFPQANIGIATGQTSGLVVLDVDLKSGGLESFAELEKKHESLSHHLQALSGGGGIHVYFRAPAELLKNRTSILPGLDFRAEGGYIVAPPSMHSSGKSYSWANSNPLQDMPLWLSDLVQTSPIFQKPATKTKSVNEGSRNSMLTSFAGFLKAKGLESDNISSAINSLNNTLCNPPLPSFELEKIAKSISKYPSWEPIKVLPSTRPQALPIENEDLPEVLRPWISDICERMVLANEYVAVPAILVISTLIGRKVRVKPLVHDNWEVVPNLWGFLVGDPGSMKSPSLLEALKPLNSLEKKSRAEFSEHCKEQARKEKDLAFELENLKQSIKLDWQQGLGKQVEQKKAKFQELNDKANDVKVEKRHKTSDVTIEKLVLILKDNPQGLLLVRDELSAWLESLAKSGREGSREFYLEAWNGNGSFSIDRISRGSTYTESICLSIFGGIQPEKLQKYIDRYDAANGRDGFLERFQLAVYPGPRKAWSLIDRKPDQEALDQVMEFCESLDAHEFDEDSPVIASFAPEAQKASNAWRQVLEQRLLEPEMDDTRKSYLSKYRSLMPSLAVIFATCKNGHLSEIIDISSTQLAIKWCEILESHMLKIMGMGQSVETSAHILLRLIKDGEIYDGQKTREIYRKNLKGLNSREKTSQALNLLEKYNYIRKVKEASNGRPSESIFINPALEKGGF